MNKHLSGVFIIFCFLVSTCHTQQQYSENSIMRCNNNDKNGPSPAFLYTCNGQMPSCKAFLIFRTRSPYVSVSSISNLLSSDPVELAHINHISSSVELPPDKEIIVPVMCSCLGQYYQANTSYISQDVSETYFSIANNTFQGLTTCNMLMKENPYSEHDLFPGFTFQIPLRCACPTEDQTIKGTKFLLSYLVIWGDSVRNISKRFSVSSRSVANANGFSDEDHVIYPFTTLLVPLPSEPLNSQTRTYHPPDVISSDPAIPQRKAKMSHRRLYIGVGIGSSLAVLCFVMFLGFFYRKGHREDAESKERQKWKLPVNFLNKIAGIEEILKIYPFEELDAATRSFNSNKKLSDSLYRGVLRGKLVAIKRKNTDVTMEIKIQSKLNHFNLVSLYGACEHEGLFYLVYEFMENGSLRHWLHDEDCPSVNSWNYRIRIASDVASGLDYLHNFTMPAYVHQDINSSNILLNTDLRAKIAKLSLARLTEPEDNRNPSTSLFLAHKGYTAPECFQAGKMTPKVDVYAFGVVLSELITGREAVFMLDGEEVLLSEFVLSKLDGRNADANIKDLIDPRLQVKHPLGYIIDQTDLAVRLVKLAVACMAREPADRLSMDKVVSALTKIQLDVHTLQSSSTELEA